MSICPHSNGIRLRLMQAYLAPMIIFPYRQPEVLSIFHLGGLRKSALGALVVKYTGMMCMEIYACWEGIAHQCRCSLKSQQHSMYNNERCCGAPFKKHTDRRLCPHLSASWSVSSARLAPVGGCISKEDDRGQAVLSVRFGHLQDTP